MDLERISDVSQVTEAEPGQPNGTSASSDTGPLITPTIEQPKTESTPERPRVEGKSTSQPSAGLFTTPSMTGSTSTKSISCTSAPTHHRKAESLPTSTTSSPPEEDSILPTTSETTMTESSTEKTSVCCSCTNSGETPVKPTSDVSRKNGGIIATGIKGNNLSVKGINSKSKLYSLPVFKCDGWILIRPEFVDCRVSCHGNNYHSELSSRGDFYELLL